MGVQQGVTQAQGAQGMAQMAQQLNAANFEAQARRKASPRATRSPPPIRLTADQPRRQLQAQCEPGANAAISSLAAAQQSNQGANAATSTARCSADHQPDAAQQNHRHSGQPGARQPRRQPDQGQRRQLHHAVASRRGPAGLGTGSDQRPDGEVQRGARTIRNSSSPPFSLPWG